MSIPMPEQIKVPGYTRSPKIIKRVDAETNPEYGTFPHMRSIEQQLLYGFVNVNKPSGPTSHQVAEYVKKIMHVPKAGHGGTLDPAVTGVLPVGLNEAVKVVRSFLHAGKEYVCYMKVHNAEVGEERIRDALAHFVGAIRQMPPKKSAVKRDWRTRTIYYIDIIEIDGPDVLFRVGCQAGTYIRKLCTDVGEHLGCGAHMQQLVRTQSARFTLEKAVTLQDLADAMAAKMEGNPKPLSKMIVSVEDATSHLPKMWVGDGAVGSLAYGAALAIPGVIQYDDDIATGDEICILSQKGELVALATAQMSSEEIQRNEKGICAKLERVIIARDVYPHNAKKNTPPAK